MDWNQINTLSKSLEDLSAETKDELFNTIAWFDCTSEEISIGKFELLFQLTQEVLKYKGEQVEVLLHELDELAIKEGEEMKQLDSDEGRSSKSRRSSIELENLEHKFMELKAKFKKQSKINEQRSLELDKLKKSIKSLEEEKRQLQRELAVSQQDDSRSDVSDSLKEQHKELTESLHNKNRQISELLSDIEVVEKENFMLREKVVKLRDELSTATKDMSSLTDDLKAAKIELNENLEIVNQLTTENNTLKEDIQDIIEQKQTLEKNLKEFTKEIEVRLEEWQKVLISKDEQIEKLKQAQRDPESSSSPSLDLDRGPHIAALQRVLNQREQQLLEIKTQLQEASNEMNESASIIKQLQEEIKENDKIIKGLNEDNKRLKDELQAAHMRCREMQEQVEYAENEADSKQKDLQKIIKKLKRSGQIDLSEYLQEIQELKAQNRVQEKQVMNLVKTVNKLQDSLDQFANENEVLRDRMGIPENDIICTDEIGIKRKIEKKELYKIKKQLADVEEKKLDLQQEIHKLNRVNASLSDQLMQSEKSGFDSGRDTLVSHEGTSRDEIKALSEENEALRKGLHEILGSVKTRKEGSLEEIKSDTLEKLLRALDVKHISGWYHPAMRLQADLHNEQGISAELREQLRLARLELDSYKKKVQESEEFVKIDDKTKVTEIDDTEKENIKDFVKSDFDLDKIKAEFEEDKKKIIEEFEQKLINVNEEVEVLNKKLKVFTDNESEDSQKSKLSAEISNNAILNRKCSYLENTNTRLSNDVLHLKTDIQNMKVQNSAKLNNLITSNKLLNNQVKILENNNEMMINVELYKEMQDKLDSISVKYRELIQTAKNIGEEKEFQISTLKKTETLLNEEKGELKLKIKSVLEKLHNMESTHDRSNLNVEPLSKKLAEAEVNEISERQRANHINNLYELVREQLQKSEDRLLEFEKYNKEILRRNLTLQEHLKDTEDKLCSYVDQTTFKKFQTDYNNLLKENSNLTQQLNQISDEYRKLEETSQSKTLWTHLQEQELLNLKHQIVDLQATSDEKTVIAQISNDIVYARANEANWKNKYESIKKEYEDFQQKSFDHQKTVERIKIENCEVNSELKKKVELLKGLLFKKRTQYFGCIPLVSEEQFLNTFKQLLEYKNQAFKDVYEFQEIKRNAVILKEQTEIENAHIKTTQSLATRDDREIKKLLKWQQEKKILMLNEIKMKRQLEFKELQLSHALQRIQMQDSQILKLEEELLQSHFSFDIQPDFMNVTENSIEEGEIIDDTTFDASSIKIQKSQQVQTAETDAECLTEADNTIKCLRIEIINTGNELSLKEQQNQQLKTKITELEMNNNLFETQLADKQSQINFYEKRILELQSRKESNVAESATNTSLGYSTNEDELVALKNSVKCLQDAVVQKEQSLITLQSVLKQDRDNHSLAAARMQEDLRKLNKALKEEKQNYTDLQSGTSEVTATKTAAVEQYMVQVQALDQHASELHTQLTCLETQLKACREEVARWRTLASDRLTAVEQLRVSLEEQHKAELIIYKNDSEKWKDEVNSLKEIIMKHRAQFDCAGSDIVKILSEKDKKIHELTISLQHLKNEAKNNSNKAELDTTPKIAELESENQLLFKELESMSKKFEQILNKERSAREEVRELRGQLLRKPTSARSDKSDRSIKEQLQKKIAALETEIADANAKLEIQMTINEQHKLKIAEDFDRWKKQKFWQQTCEKLKTKLKEKDVELEKLQQTCSGYRVLIERLEREKHNLESRVKNLKVSVPISNCEVVENLKIENMRLRGEIEKLNDKLEIQQHHSGALGAAMLQDKLEAQERKIAVLEVSSKGSSDIRNEIEKMQTVISKLQKNKMCLEAENLDLKLDIEKHTQESAKLQERVHYLESYTDVLKKESTGLEVNKEDASSKVYSDSRKISDLERTVFILKRVVEKLQTENKRLLGERRLSPKGCNDRLVKELERARDQHKESLRRIEHLEAELDTRERRELTPSGKRESHDLDTLQQELAQKVEMLEKVKILLRRAATKEKALLQEIAELKRGSCSTMVQKETS